MSTQQQLEVTRVCALPPLILHPFTESASTIHVLESAKASLSAIEHGEPQEHERAHLEQRMVEGRYAEVRMLFYVGKDIYRWLEQCVETCERSEELGLAKVRAQSFARLLIEDTPEDVAEKLKEWGVIEFGRIFSRAIGIHSQFCEPPPVELLQNDYLRHYYRYADYAFVSWRDQETSPVLPADKFPFSLYASGEYTKLLEREWQESN